MKLICKNAKSECQLYFPGRILLITGDGRSLLEDYSRFLHRGLDFDTMAIGRSMAYCPRDVQHWANVDGADCKWWAENLPMKNKGKLPTRHSIGEYSWFDVDWEPEGMFWDPKEVLWHGSTALFAVYIGLAMGYDRIYLAGCPLDSKGHWWANDEGPEWTGKCYQAWLEFAKSPEAYRVESLSGYTRQMLRNADL